MTTTDLTQLTCRGQWTREHEQAQALFKNAVRKALLDVADKLDAHPGIKRVEVRMGGGELGLQAYFTDMPNEYNTSLQLSGTVSDWRPEGMPESEE